MNQTTQLKKDLLLNSHAQVHVVLVLAYSNGFDFFNINSNRFGERACNCLHKLKL